MDFKRNDSMVERVKKIHLIYVSIESPGFREQFLLTMAKGLFMVHGQWIHFPSTVFGVKNLTRFEFMMVRKTLEIYWKKSINLRQGTGDIRLGGVMILLEYSWYDKLIFLRKENYKTNKLKKVVFNLMPNTINISSR